MEPFLDTPFHTACRGVSYLGEFHRAESKLQKEDPLEKIYLSQHPLQPFMATKSAMGPLLRLAHHRGASEFAITARRTLTTRSTALHQSCALIRPSISQCPRSSLQQAFRRSYADTKQQKYFRKSRITFRWLWRVVYIGAIGGVGYLGYTIYLLRTPSEQLEADPTKKTLVILGTICQSEAGA